MISVSHVSVLSQDDGAAILTDVSVELDASSTAVIGRNGSGKSTFARLLNGLQMPTDGVVTINGHNTATALKAVRRQVGFVFQNPDLQLIFPTVAEDMGFGLRNQGLSKDEIDRRVLAALANYGLTHLQYQATHSLSGGEKQQVAVAGVLVMSPDIVVCDEPTTLLDLPNTRLINQLLLSLTQQLIVVTHDLDLARACARVIWFEHGRIAFYGDAEAGVRQYVESVR